MSTCKACNDTGFEILDNGKRMKCICTLRADVEKYLKAYNNKDFKYHKNFPAEKFEKNIVVDKLSQIEFDGYVKSFLLNAE